MSTRVETYVGGNCRYAGGAWAACSGNQDARHIYSKLSDGATIGVNHTAPVIAPPAADFATWYENAIPGPSQSCTHLERHATDVRRQLPEPRQQRRHAVDLTPASSYYCRVGPGREHDASGALTAAQTTITVSSATGFPTTAFLIRIDDEYMTRHGGLRHDHLDGHARREQQRGGDARRRRRRVDWDDADRAARSPGTRRTKTLTVNGTIFIDGSAKVSNSARQPYNGQGTLYLSGTLLFNASLCGGADRRRAASSPTGTRTSTCS